MEKLFNISCLITITLSLIGMGLAMYSGTDWLWPLSTAIWAYVAYNINKQSNKNQNNDGKY
jgi:hypothetical protein